MKIHFLNFKAIFALTVSAILSIFSHSFAADGTWDTDLAGNWTDTTKWFGDAAYASGIDSTATFGNVITADRIITLDTLITIGNITASDTTHNYTISGANTITLDRTTGVPIINVTTLGRTLTISSQVAGNDGLIKSGAGILVLGGNNIISGNAVVNGGSLQLSGINSFGDITVNGATLASGGTAVGAGTLGAAGGTITFTGTSTYSPQRDLPVAYNKNVNISSGTTTFGMSTQFYHENFAGVLSGAGTLVKNDSNGILTFSNSANTFTGAIRLDGGSGGLVVNSLLDSANAITFNGNTGALSLGAGTASSLLFNSRQIVLAHTNGGEITNNNGSASNTITINTNLGFSGAGTRSLELGGSNIGANAFNGNITNNGASAVSVTKSGTGTWHISGDMSNSGGLTVNGGGALTLSGTNTYSGNTNFTGVNAQLTFAGSQSASANTTLFMNTSASSMSSVVKFLDDTGNVNGGSATFGGTYRIQSNNTAANQNTFFVGNNNTANGGTSSGTTTGSTLAIGTMNWNTVANNTPQVGNINIQGVNEYRLQINNVVMFNGAGHTAGNSNFTNFNPTSANVTLGSVTQAAGNAVNGVIPFLVLGGTSSDNRITGAISNASDVGTSLRPVNVTKSSTSTWTLGGTNTYTGATAISNGLLRFTGDSSAATGNVAVSGGALGGNGGSLGGAVTVSSTGGINLADGSIGSLTLGSTLGVTGALGANNLNFDLGNTTGTSDQLLVAGTTSVTTTGSAVINVNQLGGSAGRNATTYTLIGGAGTLDATNFAKFSLATTKAFGQTYSLTNTGDDLQLVATNVTGAVAANTTHNVLSGSWQATGSFTGGAAPDYQSNVIINSAVGTTPLNGSMNINSLSFGTSATTAVTISPGTASAQTNASMLVIEAGDANGNSAGNGITLSNTSGTHTISANVGLASSQTWTVATGGTLAVSGAISDFGAGYVLTKAGGGNLSLSGATTYTGGTSITGGTLTVAAASIGAFNNGPLTLSGSGRLTLSAVNVASASQVSVGTGGGRISVSGNNNFTTTGKLTGSGALTLVDPGGAGGKTFNFNSLENDFTGGIIISGGAGLALNVNSLVDSANNIAFNATGNTQSTPFSYGATAIAPLILATRAIEINGGNFTGGYTATITNNNTTQAISIGTNLIATGAGAKILALSTVAGPSNVYSGTITNGTDGGTIGVTKTGAGDWSLSNTSNSFSGAITVNAGTLAYASAGGANGISFTNTNTSVTLSYTGSGQTMSGAINAGTVTSGTVNLVASGAGAINYSNTGSLGSTGSLVKNLVLSGTNTDNNTLAGAWVNNGTGAATLTKNGTGKWVLSGNNNYTGITRVNAGTLQFANQASLYNGNSANWTAANINAKHGATFAVNVDSAASAGFDSGNLNTLLGNISVANTTAQGLQGGATIGIDTSTADLGTFTQGNAIANSTGAAGGTIGLTKLGTGTLVLDKANTYTGATTIQAGTLLLGSNDRLSNSTPVTVAGGTLDVSTFTNTVASFSMSSGALNGSGTLTAATYGLTGGTLAAKLGAGAVTVNGDVTFSAADRLNASSSLLLQGGILTLAGDQNVASFQQTGGTLAGGFSVNSASNYDLQSGTLTGNLGGSSGLNKTGEGTTILSGTNTYTGATNVNSGKLVVNGNISSSSLTSVASGATIGGSGTVGELTVSSGGFINPGNSPGILNVSGDYTQAGLYTAEITGLTAGTEHDQINVTGSVDITGGSLTALFTAGTYAANDLIFILLNDGVDAITGTYSGFAQGATVIEYDGFEWKISYTANSTTQSFTGGNDIALMAIPEPKAALLGGLGLLLLLRRRR